MRYRGAGRTSWEARCKARPTSATWPPLSDPGPLQGVPGSGFACTVIPSSNSNVLQYVPHGTREENGHSSAHSHTGLVGRQLSLEHQLATALWCVNISFGGDPSRVEVSIVLVCNGSIRGRNVPSRLTSHEKSAGNSRLSELP